MQHPAFDLAAVPWRTTRHAGIRVHFYASDRGSGRVLALIRMAPGCGYPRHRHIDDEEVLVVQGGYEDELGRYTRGAFVRYPPGSTHGPRAVDGTEDCVLLALAHEGVALVDPL
jgi:anti-sigma factor ChrR (cupin superfamily)